METLSAFAETTNTKTRTKMFINPMSPENLSEIVFPLIAKITKENEIRTIEDKASMDVIVAFGLLISFVSASTIAIGVIA